MAAALLSPRYDQYRDLDKPLPSPPLIIRRPHPEIAPATHSRDSPSSKNAGFTHIVTQVSTEHRRLRSYSSPRSERVKYFAKGHNPSTSPVPPLQRRKPSVERMQADKAYEQAIAAADSGYASIENVASPFSEANGTEPHRNMLQGTTTTMPVFEDRPITRAGTEPYTTNGHERWPVSSQAASIRRQEFSSASKGSHLPSDPAPPSLRNSKSIPEKLSNRYEPRNFSAPTFTRPNRAYSSSREMQRPPPPSRVPQHTEQYASEVRPSFYSNLTYGSSVNDTTTTDRSSTFTAQSSYSDLPRIIGSRPQTTYGDGLSVEDAIAMYIDGFETDKEVDREEEEVVQKNVIPRTLEAPPALQIQKKGHTSERTHRRSQSAGVLEKSLKPHDERPSTANNLMSPSGPILRSSTQIISNEVRHSLEAVQAAPFLDLPSSPSRDRYGFKKCSQYVTQAQYDAWNEAYTPYLARRKQRWIEFMGREGLLLNARIDKDIPIRFPARSDRTKRYIRKGIPPEWRGAAWFWYAGGPERLRKHPDMYLNSLRQVNEGKLNENDREIIERDLFRTFPDNLRFKPDNIPNNPTSSTTALDGDSSAHDSMLSSNNPHPHVETPLVRSLRRVLQAFAVHNPLIGYCQSLNFLSGLLLLLLHGDEEKTFHMLCILTTMHLPGTHGTALEGANVDIAVLMSLLKDMVPGVWAKVNDTETRDPMEESRQPTVSLATTSWFMSVFVGSLPIETVLRVWDALWYEGSKTLFRVSLALFKLAEPKIAGVRDPMEVFQLVQTLPRGLLDVNALMDTAVGVQGGRGRGSSKKGFRAVSQDLIEGRRKERREMVKRQGSGRNGRGREKGTVGGGGLKRAVSRARFRKPKKEKEVKN
ncbi:MAG: hypothetical protein M1820_007183 [Bogoriella megaspora]|nr:MAG: hypothetical protein M1820_007183 [Bogoriella megaspora]